MTTSQQENNYGGGACVLPTHLIVQIEMGQLQVPLVILDMLK